MNKFVSILLGCLFVFSASGQDKKEQGSGSLQRAFESTSGFSRLDRSPGPSSAAVAVSSSPREKGLNPSLRNKKEKEKRLSVSSQKKKINLFQKIRRSHRKGFVINGKKVPALDACLGDLFSACMQDMVDWACSDFLPALFETDSGWAWFLLLLIIIAIIVLIVLATV